MYISASSWLLFGVLALTHAGSDASSPATQTTSVALPPPTSSFLWPSTTTRYASSAPSRPITHYALPYSSVEAQFKNLSTTSWPNWTPALLPAIPTKAYDAAAYSNLWNAASPAKFTRGIYSATVSPTPVPSSELIYPPPLFYNSQNASRKFPKGFVLGAAGSSAQCEGAVADQGKSPSFLDMLYTLFTLDPALLNGIAGGSSLVPQGPLTSDYTTNEHYYLYKQDVERMAALGLKQYSFSIPMVRILPFALPGTPVNSEALQHYSDVVDFVLSKGMEPIVTLHHWETPLQFYGGGSFGSFASALVKAQANSTYGLIPGFTFGFQNATFEDAYVNHAKIVMSHLGDRVPRWVTFNEPQVGATNGAAVRTVLRAHARAVRFYRETMQGKARVSMKMGTAPVLPSDPSKSEDVEAANIFNDVYIGAFLKPLVFGQDYPEYFKIAVPDYVPLTKTDLSMMKDTMDYVSFDIYSPTFVTPLVPSFSACAHNLSTSNPDRRFPICLNTTTLTPTGWATGWNDNSGSIIAANTVRTQLRYLYQTYRKPVMISETGFPTPAPSTLGQNLYNLPQSVYLLNELDQVLAAMDEDGVQVEGMLVWNWGDDLEFVTFDGGFGLMFVNHTTQERRYRRSFFDVVDFVESRRSS